MTPAAATAPRRALPPFVQPLLAQGRGLNSIPIRFALMAAMCSGLGAMVLADIVLPMRGTAAPGWIAAMLVLVVGAPTAVTYLAARKLTRAILALRQSTDAIARGDVNRPVDVDCACEVGGLADSFRAMIRRLNSNVVRMNVLAFSDPVTHLPNRAVISHVLGLMKRDGARGSCSGALLFLDLDGFKRVNDTLGHEAGDQLLRLVTDRLIRHGLGLARDGMEDGTSAFGELRDSCPERPLLARFAGDEFVLLLPGLVADAAVRAAATRLIDSLAAPFEVQGTALHATARIGIARLPLDTTDPEQLLGYADIALHAAKQGGDSIRFLDSALLTACLESARIETDLRGAIEREELVLHYQPKIDCISGSVTGLEALVRWPHPTEGMILPGRFVAAAERSNLIIALGASVLRMAVCQIRAWQDRGMSCTVAVNVSAAQLDQPGFVPEVLELLAAHGVDPRALELEVTESMMMSRSAAVRERLSALRAAGIGIAIDDFGTGYSNLSQIADLPADSLKLDRSLVEGLGRDTKAGTIVAATIGMAHALGHRVIGEGIENARQLETLVSLGCDAAQGFLIARPMPVAELERWLATRPGAAALQAA